MASNVQESRIVEIPNAISVRDLAEKLEISPVELLKALISNGIMATITQNIDYETAAIVAEDLGFTLYLEGTREREEERKASEAEEASAAAAAAERAALAAETAEIEAIPWFIRDEDEEKLVKRPPVVTVMGHVDHGKTSILDAIRDARVAAGESGGITQHIGAYTIDKGEGSITFIDTPGHEAFTAMRARGAQATDIAIIVVAADDGMMPQTREAIDHARAANVPIIVAVNKIDLPGAKPDRVIEQLAEIDLVAEDWGGDTIFSRVSATTGEGLDELLDAILLVAEENPPLGNPNRAARGMVLEGKVDQQRGVVATLLVQSGVLNRGDTIVVDQEYGRVRAMFDDRGETLKSAPQSTPVEIMGLSEVPIAGSRFEVVKNEKTAKALVTQRAYDARGGSGGGGGGDGVAQPMTLEELFAQAAAGEVRTLNLIVKTDVQGTLEPVVDALERLSGAVKVRILLSDIGDINESDVNLAAASGAVVLGFRTSPDPRGQRAATAQHVEIREYEVIYKMVEDVQDALVGMLDPVYESVTIGRAEVRQIFSIPRQGKIAGCSVLTGTIRRNATVRVMRGEEEVAESTVSSLKRFTEDVREVREGFECGISLSNFNDYKESDVLEFFVKERVR
jgi:translation initiation factor IF-2